MKNKFTAIIVALTFMGSNSLQAQAEEATYESRITAVPLDCAVEGSPQIAAAGVLLPLISVGLETVFSMVFESIDSSLEKKLKAYQKSESFRLELGNIEAYKCIKISRVEGNETYLELKYIVELIEVEQTQITAFRLRPYSVKGTLNPYGPKGSSFAFSNSVQATTIGAFGPTQISANKNERLLSRKYSGEYSVDFSKESDFSDQKNMSDPVFRVFKRNGRALPVTLIFTHSEVGSDRREGKLKRWRKFLEKSSDGLNETFTTAITKLIESDE